MSVQSQVSVSAKTSTLLLITKSLMMNDLLLIDLALSRQMSTVLEVTIRSSGKQVILIKFAVFAYPCVERARQWIFDRCDKIVGILRLPTLLLLNRNKPWCSAQQTVECDLVAV